MIETDENLIRFQIKEENITESDFNCVFLREKRFDVILLSKSLNERFRQAINLATIFQGFKIAILYYTGI